MKKLITLILILFPIISMAQTYEEPKLAIGFKLAKTGVPNALMDKFIYEHPTISGNSYTIELKTFGSKGSRSIFSGVYGFEYSSMEGDGYWRIDMEDKRKQGLGDIKQYMFSATIIMNIFPSSPIHPYIGAGIGLGYMSYNTQSNYMDETGTKIKDDESGKMLLPVGHLPVGIIVNYRDRLEFKAEAGFKNGFYAGLAISYII